MIAVSIGSKDKSLYSTEAALTSLASFAEAAGMNLILDIQDLCMSMYVIE